MSDSLDKSSLSSELKAKVEHAVSLLQTAHQEYGDVTFANSLGAEDVVINDLICRFVPEIEVFSLDTGRLPEETLTLLAKLEEHYDRKVKVYYPEANAVESYVREKGINAFYQGQDLRKACCHVRKVEPLKRALSDKKAWVTGIRREQAMTRGTIAFNEWDEGNQLQKINPLADWTEKEVWAYIKAEEVPYNELHDLHYPSIGCAPCTRAIAVGEDVRAGRWWWENPDSKECGLHPVTSLKKPS
ncbi:phosphoadenylyl-sulfate reductase [Motiliproteus sp. MSK22-1]|uniref:phosphoadenylyl-sulfate reductase n=1 Tax=Motiliproteus sp. MSK22-1 TaxID=1897630 RepID=UPI0018E9F39F|nr:phosphoadenylyl-sulfate reductase [Motiliproteus sp. MSK22-1]